MFSYLFKAFALFLKGMIQQLKTTAGELVAQSVGMEVSSSDGHGGNFCLRVIRKLPYTFLFDQYTRCIFLKSSYFKIAEGFLSFCYQYYWRLSLSPLYNQRLLSTMNSLS